MSALQVNSGTGGWIWRICGLLQEQECRACLRRPFECIDQPAMSIRRQGLQAFQNDCAREHNAANENDALGAGKSKQSARNRNDVLDTCVGFHGCSRCGASLKIYRVYKSDVGQRGIGERSDRCPGSDDDELPKQANALSADSRLPRRQNGRRRHRAESPVRADPVTGSSEGRARRLQLCGQLSPFRDVQRAQSAFFSAASTAALSGQIVPLS